MKYVVIVVTIITCRVSHRRCGLYIGHARLCVCVCLSVCLCVSQSVCPRRILTQLHGPGCSLRTAGVPHSCELLGRFTIGAPVSSVSACTRSMPDFSQPIHRCWCILVMLRLRLRFTAYEPWHLPFCYTIQLSFYSCYVPRSAACWSNSMLTVFPSLFRFFSRLHGAVPSVPTTTVINSSHFPKPLEFRAKQRQWLVGWSLTSLFSTNTAISQRKEAVVVDQYGNWLTKQVHTENGC